MPNRTLPDLEERREIIRQIPWVSEITKRHTTCHGMTLTSRIPHPCKVDARWEFVTADERKRRYCFMHLIWRGLYGSDLEAQRVNRFLRKKFPQYSEGILR